MITINMAKARDIKRDMIRAERNPKLAALDVDYMKASEAQDTAAMAAIAQVKQQLRDCTQDPAIEAAQTPDELKAVRPSVLDL